MNKKLSLPLAGLKVLELGHIVAGPTAGQILGDMGADVIKVESVTGGDQARTMPGATIAMFHFLNRNKRSVALDLKGEGREIFLKMANTADIIVDNFAYGAVDGLGVGYDVVSAFNPGVIWLSIKGYLPGPAEGRSMLDELAQMAGGLAFMTGTPEKPTRAGSSVIDVGAATYGIVAVLGALRQREIQGGRGQRITAGLLETSVYLVAQWMATAQYSGEASIPMSSIQQDTRMGFGIYRLFETSDKDRVFIGIISNTHWERFCKAFELNHLFADARYKDNAGRVANRPELNAAVAKEVLRYSSDEAQRKLQAAGVPFAPVRRPDQLADDPHLLAAGQLVEMDLPNGVKARLPKLPFCAEGFDMPIRSGAPSLGADTRSVLEGLGYSTDAIDGLRARGAINTGEK